MRRPFLDLLRCPACLAERPFELLDPAEDELEIRQATLRCRTCAHQGRVQRGIVDLMHAPPEFVTREAQGLERFADEMRAQGWDRETLLSLPYRQDGYWYAQATAMHQALYQNDLQPGQVILDIGSNTCWASARFAERGLQVVALDILADQMQGLGTADVWMREKSIHFERLRSVMFAPALASACFDWVWCSEVLHHNHHANLKRTLAELHRVLKPGGRVIAVNETVRSLRHPAFRPRSGAVADVDKWEGHEHSYLRHTYLRAARRAGFDVAVKGPWYLPAFEEAQIELSPQMSVRQAGRAYLAHILRRMPRLRIRYLTWKTYVTGGVALFFIAVKPRLAEGEPGSGPAEPGGARSDPPASIGSASVG